MISRSTAVLGFGFALFGVVQLGGCRNDDDGCPTGEVTCPCYPNGTCNGLLQCDGIMCDTASAGDDAGDDVGGEPIEGGPCMEAGTMSCGNAIDGRMDVALSCNATGTYDVAFECPGLQSCTAYIDRVGCGGTEYAVSGQPCADEGNQVCTIDGAVVLVCTNGVWIDGVHCPPSTCELVPEMGSSLCSGHWCANCGYTPGDVCGFQAGAVNCSTDLTKIVQCTNGIVTVTEECLNGTTCTLLVGDVLDCA